VKLISAGALWRGGESRWRTRNARAKAVSSVAHYEILVLVLVVVEVVAAL